MSDPKNIEAYIAQLTPMEKKVLKIATSHLETSFSLVKSIGYQEWQQAQKQASSVAQSQQQASTAASK